MGFLRIPLNPVSLTCGLTAAEATQGKEQGKELGLELRLRIRVTVTDGLALNISTGLGPFDYKFPLNIHTSPPQHIRILPVAMIHTVNMHQ